MKRMWMGTTALVAIMALSGCGNDSGNGGNATVTDTGTGGTTDTGATGGTDAGATDSGSAATDTGSGTTDTGSGTTDTGSTGTDKCAPTDNACLQTCGTAKCTTELTACNTDKACAGLITCLNGCAQGVQAPKPASPVQMPDGSTPDSCNDYCIVAAGDTGYKKLGDMQLCIQSKCIKSEPGKTDNCVQGTPSFNDCLNTCMTIQCTTELTTCNNSKDCTSILTCLNACGSDQSCSQNCQLNASAKGAQELNAMIGCMQSKCIAAP